EAHRQKGVDGAQREGVHDHPAAGGARHLSEDQEIGCHEPYISAIRSPNMSSMALRFTFCVAVSSPSSWSSSLGRRRNLRMFSTRANLSLVASTTPLISSITSGFSDRSR